MSFLELLEFIVQYLEIELEYEFVEDDYCYCDHDNLILSMNIEDAYINEQDFLEFASSLNPRAKEFNILLWSLLHEVGHTKEVEIDDNDWLLRSILLIDNNTQNAYFRLPRELAASTWAANFISNNYKKCKIVNDIIEGWLENEKLSTLVN